MGSQAPYGYMKSPEDKHKLIIDEEAAVIVRRLFNGFANGESARMMADKLNDEGINTPRFYHYEKQVTQEIRIEYRFIKNLLQKEKEDIA